LHDAIHGNRGADDDLHVAEVPLIRHGSRPRARGDLLPDSDRSPAPLMSSWRPGQRCSATPVNARNPPAGWRDLRRLSCRRSWSAPARPS
jgi:hypothetical protein